MAISTYSDLLSSALDVIGREGDASLTAYAPVAIGLVEAKLNRHLRAGEMEATTNLTGSDGVFMLPADFAAWRTVRGPAYGALEYVTPEWAPTTFPTGGGGVPRYFTVKGGSLSTFPAATGSITLDYYQKIPALSDAAPTNWLLASHPDIYLFLTLSELNAFTKDGEAALIWNQRGMTAVEELKSFDVAGRYSNVAMRVKGPTP